MSEKQAPQPSVPETRDHEINRLQRAMNHLLTSYQMATARAASLAAENEKLKKIAIGQQAELASCAALLQAQQQDMTKTWVTALEQAKATVQYMDLEMTMKGFPAGSLENVATAIGALISEASPAEVAETMKNAGEGSPK